MSQDFLNHLLPVGVMEGREPKLILQAVRLMLNEIGFPTFRIMEGKPNIRKGRLNHLVTELNGEGYFNLGKDRSLGQPKVGYFLKTIKDNERNTGIIVIQVRGFGHYQAYDIVLKRSVFLAPGVSQDAIPEGYLPGVPLTIHDPSKQFHPGNYHRIIDFVRSHEFT